jgi:DNA-binding NarL/FixJ family response regulator
MTADAPIAHVDDSLTDAQHHADGLPPELTRRDGFALPGEPWDLTDRAWVCVGSVDDVDDVGDAVLARARGVSVVVGSRPGSATREQLLDDLGRIGPVTTSIDASRGRLSSGRASGVDQLDGEALELLALLADGASVPEAATAIHVSLRTAERRLARIRTVLGVRTIAEAVAIAAATPPAR